MTTPSSLDPILAEPDPTVRLPALTVYVTRAEDLRVRANAARRETVRAMRAERTPEGSPVWTWRALSDLSGLSEQYLRQLVSKR